MSFATKLIGRLSVSVRSLKFSINSLLSSQSDSFIEVTVPSTRWFKRHALASRTSLRAPLTE